MKSFEKDIKKYANKIRLRASERSELRERVLTYMEYHPLPKQSLRDEVEKIESDRFKVVHFNTIYTRIFAGVFAVLLIVAVPFAAERAVPGDVLYPFKTQVNEGIRSQLANSPYEKIALETELMERRISEARLLENEGKLTKEIETAISETVQGHADAAQEGIAELRNSSTDEAAIAEITFGSALEIQSAVLNAQATKRATSASSTSTIAQVVQKVQKDIASHKSTATPSFEKLMARVELETTRAYELFASINESTTAEQRNDIERRLEDISRKMEKAQKLHAEEDPQAVGELISALALTQKLIIFMTDIDVSTSVSLEQLVPIELTDEERTAIVGKLLTNVEELHSTVQARVEYIDDAALLEKVSTGLGALSASQNTATTSLASGDIHKAEIAVANAYEFATDLIEMTDAIAVPESVSTEGTESVKDSEEEKATTIETGTSTTSSSTIATSTPTSTQPAE